MYRSKKLFIAFSVCVSIKTICIASLLQEQEKELNEIYYLGDKNGFLIVNNNNTPFKFKLYPQTTDINNIEGSYIETSTGYLYSEDGFLLATEENNEIICILNGSKVHLALAEEDEKKGKIECELFKKTNSNNLKLVFVQDNKPVTFNKEVTFSLLPYNYLQQKIEFIELKAEGGKTLTNTEGHPLLASIENDKITIFYKKEEEGCFNTEITTDADKRYEVKLVKEDSSIKTKLKDCCCCFSWCF